MSNPARQALRAYETEAWRRWEMESVELPAEAHEPPEASDEESISLPAHILEEIAWLKSQAKKEGQEQGRAEGHKEGYRQGLAEGRAQGLEEGRAQGAEEGRKEALGEGQARNQAEVEKLAALLHDSAEALHDIEAETGQALVRLAISISQQVIRSTLSVEPEKILDTIQDVLHMDGGQEGLLRLRLHPDDLALVQPHLADDPAARHWRLQADPTIERGGCIADTALGSIDATLQTRWQRVVGSLGHNMPWTSSP